ncbi:hypothetical protein [Amycolatopsis albispora]|uniref:ADP-heptose:LPS heptosyltransferase n=1 Tax=Amycolatopsis albispora TaxID=1804986 RepID=A0A344LIW7_9PSEU|nr:hypothetical protein [Amycolatopsis albispora]AXB47991.1 hypothetical protein A4R43_40710 [Amycolatopsis albispora]
MTDRTLVNFFYAHPIGHAVEALYYANGHHAARPDREIAVALNSATAVEFADYCPFVSAKYAMDHSFVDPCPDSADRLAVLPREWDHVIEDGRRYQDFQLELFPGMRDYYAAADEHLIAREKRTFTGDPRVGYLPRQQLRFELPVSVPRVPRIAVLPGGSSEPALYPSAGSWLLILDALTEALPDAEIVLLGKTGQDGRTTTSMGERGMRELLAHRSKPVNAVDVPLVEQLALVRASDVFLSPHTGFGLAVLAVGTPWLTISGGRWFEYFFNGVPFRSIIPDTSRFPSYSQFDAAEVVDGDDGPRTPSMSRARIEADLDRIVSAAVELSAGTVSYEQALRDYFPALLAAHGGDASGIWSIDGVHLDYLR